LRFTFPYPNRVSGGVDFEAAKDIGVNVIWALSLPGKAAPVTSGKIIKDTALNILSEMGV
jgi:dipicolinate synthase subunit A